MCLRRAGVVHSSDVPALSLRVFPAYMRVVRRLQRTYFLEPAGSHGVWSLDDYQMLVFLFGSAQLISHPMLRPDSVRDPAVLEAYSSQYLYLAAIRFVNEMKHGAPFPEHSPILFDLSGQPTWERVHHSLRRTFVTEVLGKRPVVQHILFGTLLPATWESHGMEAAVRAAARTTGSHGTALAAGIDPIGVHKAPWAALDAAFPADLGIEPATRAPWATEKASAKPADAAAAEEPRSTRD